MSHACVAPAGRPLGGKRAAAVVAASGGSTAARSSVFPALPGQAMVRVRPCTAVAMAPLTGSTCSRQRQWGGRKGWCMLAKQGRVQAA